MKFKLRLRRLLQRADAGSDPCRFLYVQFMCRWIGFFWPCLCHPLGSRAGNICRASPPQRKHHVRFTPESGHVHCTKRCLL